MGRIWKLLGCKWLPFHDVPCFCFASLTWIFCTFLMFKSSNSNIPYGSNEIPVHVSLLVELLFVTIKACHESAACWTEAF